MANVSDGKRNQSTGDHETFGKMVPRQGGKAQGMPYRTVVVLGEGGMLGEVLCYCTYLNSIGRKALALREGE